MASSDYIRSQIRSLEVELKTMKSRLGDVEDINAGLAGKINNAAEAVNKQIDNCEKDLGQGIDGVSHIYDVRSDIINKKEPSANTDELMYTVLFNLTKELQRCEGEIARLKNAIKQKEWELEQALERERAELLASLEAGITKLTGG